jgi:hypothetical protein
MLTPQQQEKLLVENKSLYIQLQDANYMLGERENELALLKNQMNATAAFNSEVNLQNDEVNSLKLQLNEAQQKTTAALSIQNEMQVDLKNVDKEWAQFEALQKQHNHALMQLEDLQIEVNDLKTKNKVLQNIAVRIGEVESELSIVVEENNLLKAKVELK